MSKPLIPVKYTVNGASSWTTVDELIGDRIQEIVDGYNEQMNEVLQANKLLMRDLNLAKVELANYKNMRWNNAYNIVINAEGYITSAEPLSTVIDTPEMPEDIQAGYYTIVNGRIVVDEAKKAAMQIII